jgi:predicted DNA binding CopG/RHH family protein
MLNLNTLKTENEQLLDNAESEIKRMSDFVDKFTQDTEANKKKMIADFEQRLSQERIKAEETRQRISLEKSDAEAKLAIMQKELDAVK